MKLLIPLIVIALLISCSAKKSVSNQKIANTSQPIADTVLYEDPQTGEIGMIITQKNRVKKGNTMKRFPKSKSGDTVYYENPKTGNMEMMIVK